MRDLINSPSPPSPNPLVNQLLNWPTRKYGTIYADPGWKYNNFKTGGSMNSGASQFYTTMSNADLALLPVAEISKKDSVCFMWCTTPFQEDGLKLLRAWGFNHKTTIFWHKSTRRGMGYWMRGDVEMLFLGVRGKVKPFKSSRSNHVSHKRLQHSEKPEIFRTIIEEITKNQEELLTPRIELFARTQVDEWDAWGDFLVP